MAKRKPRLTRYEKKQIYKTVEKYKRMKREEARRRKAIKLNDELNEINNLERGAP